jgi:hypothetical protein
MELTTDNWIDRKANLRTVTNPSWFDVETAIKYLDAKHKTEVLLESDAQISVGGGAGQYFVYIFIADERNLILTDLSKPDGFVHLIVGGLTGTYPLRNIVDIDLAMRTTKVFYETEQAVSDLTWVED